MTSSEYYRNYSDKLYIGDLGPLCKKIIETRQFKRLLNIKQLGCVHLAFSDATHSRYEHSIGVCKLAGLVCNKLAHQPELNITDNDILCVKVAGLCHDLGHGPFSHSFQNEFISLYNKEWKHEQASVEMFKHLIKVNNLSSEFTDKDVVFIQELILCDGSIKDKPWKYKGRDESKSFLYEIISNGYNGIDVDKWDYIMRDWYFLNNKTHKWRCWPLLDSIKVMNKNSRLRICYKIDNILHLNEMYKQRGILYEHFYKHPDCVIYEYKLIKLLISLNSTLKLSESIYDMSIFEHTTDLIVSDFTLLPHHKFICKINYDAIDTVNKKNNIMIIESNNYKKQNFIDFANTWFYYENSIVDNAPNDLIEIVKTVYIYA